jgi:hypothetical protein
MQARMLQSHTRIQQTPALVVTAWYAARATLGCVTERWKTFAKWKMGLFFCLPQHFCHNKFLTERCTANETLKSWLLTLSTGNSTKARVGCTRTKQHDGWTTGTEPAGPSVPWHFYFSSIGVLAWERRLGGVDFVEGSVTLRPAVTQLSSKWSLWSLEGLGSAVG